MAYSAKGAPWNGESQGWMEKNLGYDYPDGRDWKPNSDLHRKVVSYVMEKATGSANFMSRRHDAWQKIDRSLTSYVTLDDAEKIVKKNDSRKPVSVVVPISYAILEATLTYLAGAFFDKMFDHLDGKGPEDVVGTLLLKEDLKQQFIRAQGELFFHTQWRDSLAYGLGAMGLSWHTEYGNQMVAKPDGYYDEMGNMIYTGAFSSMEEREVLWEGHRFENIDPYFFLPDPNTPVHKYQDGEFIGWLVRDNKNRLLSAERAGDDMFNARYLKYCKGYSSIAGKSDARTERYSSDGDEEHLDLTGVTDVIYMYANIVPSELGLGDSEYPEKWMFAVANDRLVLQAQPLNLNHNMYPVTVCAPKFDGYSMAPISMLEMLYPMQELTDWYLSSHVANVRKTMNDILVCDPFKINMKDVLNRAGKAGGIIRTRRANWGTSLKDAIMQLPVADVTRGHVADMGYVIGIMERISGASNSLQGIFDENAPERRTKAEFQGVTQNARSRMELNANLIFAMSIRPTIDLMAAQTIQLRSMDSWTKISGDWPMQLMMEYQQQEGRVFTRPQDLNVKYDIASSGAHISGAEDTQLMMNLLQLAAGIPQIAVQHDLGKMFRSVARRAGEKNIDSYIMAQPVLMPDQQVQQQADAGNLVPTQEAGNV